jgi:hypothetical protein
MTYAELKAINDRNTTHIESISGDSVKISTHSTPVPMVQLINAIAQGKVVVDNISSIKNWKGFTDKATNSTILDNITKFGATKGNFKVKSRQDNTLILYAKDSTGGGSGDMWSYTDYYAELIIRVDNNNNIQAVLNQSETNRNDEQPKPRTTNSTKTLGQTTYDNIIQFIQSFHF